MILNILREVIYEFYERGRPLATEKTISKEDIGMMCKMSLSNKMIKNYYASKKLNEGDEYYITSSILSVQRFPLCDPDARGGRKVDMTEFDLYRLPKNAHITNAYPIGCSGSGKGSISMVQPGEEVFYLKDKFSSFKFGVPKGRLIYFYHLDLCVNSIDVESTFDSDEIEVSLDVAYDTAREVLGTMLNIPFFIGKNPENTYMEPHAQLRQRLTQAQQQQPNG